MKYYERLINDTCDRPLLPAMEADDRIAELEMQLIVATSAYDALAELYHAVLMELERTMARRKV